MKKFKLFNLAHNIPIMRDQTIDFLYHQFDKYNVAQVLEIGTAYGYSSLYLSKHPAISKIVTLENDIERFGVAKEYTKNEAKINAINVSAFDYEPQMDFDCIILDGPKSKQEILFDKFSKHLKPNGFIFIDNINHYQNSDKPLTKNKLNLKEKIEKFKAYILSLSNTWDVKIYDIDDGFVIMRKKDENMN